MIDAVISNCGRGSALILHYVKSVQIRSFSGPYFPVFGLNTGKCGPENTVFGHLSRSVVVSLGKYI